MRRDNIGLHSTAPPPGGLRNGHERGGVGGFLITGGAGFIGSHLADAVLAAGHRVRVLDDLSTGRRANLDPRCERVVGAVADPASVRAALAGLDGCFHLAAIASVVRGNEDWLGTHRVNQTGTVTVLQAARDAGCERGGHVPVVYASSAAVYGDLGGQVAREALRPAPLTAYGADKLGSELHARVAWQVHGVPTLGLRFFNVYGPRQDAASPYSGVVSIFAAKLAAGAPLAIHGEGTQTRDLVFVADAVAHLLAAMRRLAEVGGAEVLNVCTGRGISVLELAQVLARLHGRPPRLLHGPARAGDIAHSLGDPAAAIASLGLHAATPLADGLAATLAWLQPAAA
jgi:UDP-glucose 4-epimerase